MTQVSLESLKSDLEYNPKTGLFTRITNVCGHSIGSIVGYLDSRKRYLRIGIRGKVYAASHLAWFYMTEKWPKDQIDHINGDKLDNRISNLREASGYENARNRSRQRNNTSGYKGVCWSKEHQLWKAYVRHNKKRIHVGYFADLKTAYAERSHLALRLHGDFARLS